MRLDDTINCKAIGENGFKLIESIYKKQSTINILTHCNAVVSCC